MLFQKLKLSADGQALHWDFHMGQVRDEIFTVTLASKEDEMILFKIIPFSQLGQHALRPGPALSCRHGVEGNIVRFDDLIEINQTISGGKNVDGIRLELRA
jgi:hypothetical protein